MLTRRSTVALALLFAAGSMQAHTVTHRSHAASKKRTAHVAGKILKVPLLAQSPLTWGQDVASFPAPELTLTLSGPTAPGLAVGQAATAALTASVAGSEFKVPVLAQLPLHWGQHPEAVSLESPSMLVESAAPGLVMTRGDSLELASPLPGVAVVSSTAPVRFAQDAAVNTVTELRDDLVQLAMSLRDIPYVSGGDKPSTGFDCSGFVRYVFAHAIGMQLPANAASQFVHGLKVSRGRLKTGDLVFFHTSGRRRISHVGIYLSDGRFIHAPTTGKSVEVSSLRDSYWSRHFAGARRPAAIVAAATNG